MIAPLRLITSKTIAKSSRNSIRNYRRAVTNSWSQSGLLPASFIDLDDDLDKWPRKKINSVINVCAQGERMVVERLGKLDSIKESGWFFAIPFVDNIRFVIDMREKALSISPQSAITKDNVHVLVSGNLYCQFVNPEKAAYGSKVYIKSLIARLTNNSLSNHQHNSPFPLLISIRIQFTPSGNTPNPPCAPQSVS